MTISQIGMLMAGVIVAATLLTVYVMNAAESGRKRARERELEYLRRRGS